MMRQKSYLEIELESLNKVVAICFYGRSGSFFFQSLLDNHPDIISFPVAYLMRYFYEFWNSCANIRTIEELISKFTKDYDILFDVENPNPSDFIESNVGIDNNFHCMGEKKDQRLEINKELFEVSLFRILSKKKVVTRKVFFQAIHLAYAHSQGKKKLNNGKPPIIVFQLHTPMPQRALGLVEDFSDTLFFHTIRNPIQSLGSHMAHYFDHQGNGMDINLLLWLLDGAVNGGYPVFNECRKHSFAVKLEDLHRHSEKIMREVCGKIGIAWHENLLKSTFGGFNWTFKSGKEKIKGFNTTVISRKHENLFSEFDRMRLSLLLKPQFDSWGYEFDADWYGFEEWGNPEMIRLLMQYPFRFETLYYPNKDDYFRNREVIKTFLSNVCQKFCSQEAEKMKPLNLLRIDEQQKG